MMRAISSASSTLMGRSASGRLASSRQFLCPSPTHSSARHFSRTRAHSLQPTPQLAFTPSPTQHITTPILLGSALIGGGLLAGMLMRGSGASGAAGAGKWHKGGFQNKMDKKEAALVLGLRETALTRARVKEAHRRMMIANHPDRGGSPFIASKVNEAKVRILQHKELSSHIALRE
ncbi:Molecular chaperone (DnaJ superfamily) [Ceraceosorus bombacis]|uniref:Mitochondrial import inner membrane translocase subunit TIM14 n=1 Tax=Ceraceosorus bombacis TaxID=401625 RepID=A0A0P1BL23_9BASI|nr:Molecular chaperone (DnaJ superfamily) [Ceraceosorus bombacis]